MAESVCSTALRCLSSTQQFHSRAKREWRACAYFTQSAVPAFPRGGYHRLSSDTKSFRLSSRNVYYGFSSGVLSSSFHVRCAADSGDGDGRTSVSTEESKTEPPSEKELGAPHHKGSLLHSPETNDGLADFGEETNGSSRTLLHNPQTDDSAAESALESSGANGSVKDESSTDEVEDTRLRLEGSLGSVVEAAEKVAEAAVEVVSETVEVAVQTVSTVGEIVDPPLVEEPVVDQGVALKTVAFWVSAAVAFGTIVGFKEGTSKASEFFAGYLLEQSLSVDNLFVFVLIFNYFRVPYAYQSRVLTYGIAGAVVFRATMIGLGIASLERFEALNLLFAAILIFSSVKLFTESEEEDDDLSNNFIVKLCRKILPVTSSYDGHKFLTVADGVTKATPLLLTLIVVEISDIAFAVDSIPAVFGVTRDPFIVFSSNIFAILGLRSLYTIISGSMAELQYLQPSVGVVLGFIGVKMVCEYFGFHVPTEASLGVVAAVLGVGIALSLKDSPKED
ncbi:hypothetical protein R1sor_023210 [Riccia sorocarpa]|uniref:Integral membrane protein TerC n=1 Tax=Riccia sorocarpa TaxID=122646 RepID=A0ABD3GT06_9MARC